MFELTGRKALVNVGSVGQPRDGDPRSCYVVIDDDSVIFRRLANKAHVAIVAMSLVLAWPRGRSRNAR